MANEGADGAVSLADDAILTRCFTAGVTRERLEACLDRHDNWGGMVHSFEYLTVLSAVLAAMKRADGSDVGAR